MRGRGWLRRNSHSILDPTASPPWDEGESSRSMEYRTLIKAIQALSMIVLGLVAQQQLLLPLEVDRVEPEPRPAPPPPLEVEEPIELIPTATYHKTYMSARPPYFRTKGSRESL